LWELDRYEDFLAARRMLIAQAINERMVELTAELEPPKPQKLSDMLTGENAALEYKSSVRWDLRTQQVNKALAKSVTKTVAGFLNSEGGTLLVGVADDCTVLGIEYDLKTIRREDRDGYEQMLQQTLVNALGAEFSQYWYISFEESESKTVCIVQVDPSPEPVYLTDKGFKEFYVRVGNTTRSLDVQAAHDYIGMHWPA
jgi:predicted HTH transcriptional regulator